MRGYHVTDLTAEDVRRLVQRLHAMELDGGLDGLFWLPVPTALLSAVQREHAPDCGPYAMALEVGEDALSLEFLVRARGILRCQCIHYASPELQLHMLRYLQELLAELGIDA